MCRIEAMLPETHRPGKPERVRSAALFPRLRANVHRSNPYHIITSIVLGILLITNLSVAQKEIKDYSSKPPEEIASAIGNDLASNDPLRRDRAILFLSILINNGKKSQKEHETVLVLAEDRNIVNIASDIVVERLAGWYEERESTERSMPLYYPLIHLLSISKNKTAAMTLSMALPLLGFDAFFRKSVFSNKLVLKTAWPKLAAIENRLCCLYPGKDLVCDMQAIDFRLTMLRMYLEAAKDNDSEFPINDIEMKKYVSGCLDFGDGNKGRSIRALAVEIACILIMAGQNDLLPAVKRIAAADPSYLYRAGPADSNSLPQYTIKSRYYPVREKAGKALSDGRPHRFE
jgi:hypothetical protein